MRKSWRKWLRRGLWVVLGLLLLVTSSYAWLTRPANLRAAALRALQQQGVRGVEIGSVAFSPFDGLVLSNIEYSPAQDELYYRSHPGIDFPPLLHISHVRIATSFWSLLRGRMRTDHLAIGGLTLTLISDAADLGGTWVEPPRGAGTSAERWRELLNRRLPNLSIDQASIRLYRRAAGRPLLVERWEMSGRGVPSEDGYELTLSRSAQTANPLIDIRWDAQRSELRLHSDWIAIETARQLLPPRVFASLDTHDLSGRFRIDGLTIASAAPVSPEAARDSEIAFAPNPMQVVSAKLHMADVRCVWPLARPEGAPAPEQDGVLHDYLSARDFGGDISWQRSGVAAPGRLEVRVSGEVRTSPASLHMVLEGDPGDLFAPAERSSAMRIRELDARLEQFDLPTIESQPRVVQSPDLPMPMRTIIHDYLPYGPVTITARISPATAQKPVEQRLEVDLEVLGGGCRYHRFPYQFSDARGFVRFRQGKLYFDGLTARHGSASIAASGMLTTYRGECGFDLRFRGFNIPLDHALHAALPPSQQAVWNRANPLGVADVDVHIERAEYEPGRPESPLHSKVSARILAGSLQHESASRLNRADICFTATGDDVVIHDLHAFNGPSELRARGEVDASRQGRENFFIEICNIPMQRETAIGADPSEVVSFEGTGDVIGQLHRVKSGEPAAQELAVVVHRGRVTAFDPGSSWSIDRAVATLRGNQASVAMLTATQGDARLIFRGAPPEAADEGEPAFDLDVRGPALEALCPQFVPSGWRGMCRTIGLSGPGSVRVRRDAAADERALALDIEAANVRPEAIPIPLHSMHADVRVAPGHFDLRSAAAKLEGGAAVSLSGRGGWSDDGSWGGLNLSVAPVVLTAEMISSMPAGLGRLLNRIKAGGRVGVQLDELRWEQRRGERVWQIGGVLNLDSAQLELGLPITECTGTLRGACRIDAAGRQAVDAQFAIDHARVDGRPVTRWEGQIVCDAESPEIHILDIRARYCDGEAIGSLLVDSATSEYQFQLTLSDARLAEVLPNHDENEERPGRIDGNIYLRGKAGDPATRSGGGRLRVRGASIMKLPILSSVAKAGRAVQRIFGDSAEEVNVDFQWDGSMMRLTRIDMQNREIRLKGDGSWNTRTGELDLTLLGASPADWPRIAVLTDIIEGAGQELVQYRVEGTVENPRVAVEPLHRLNDAFRRILGRG